MLEAAIYGYAVARIVGKGDSAFSERRSRAFAAGREGGSQEHGGWKSLAKLP